MTAPDAAGIPDSRSTPGPGQAAYEAFHETYGPDNGAHDWELAEEGYRRRWAVAEQASVDARIAGVVHAGDGGTVVVAFREVLDPENTDELYRQWAERAGSVRLVITDGAAAVAVQGPQAAKWDRTGESLGDMQRIHAELLDEILRNADDGIKDADEAPEEKAETYVRWLEANQAAIAAAPAGTAAPGPHYSTADTECADCALRAAILAEVEAAADTAASGEDPECEMHADAILDLIHAARQPQAAPDTPELVAHMAATADEFDRIADQCREAMRDDPDEPSRSRKAARASAYRACAVAVRHGLRTAAEQPQAAPELAAAMAEPDASDNKPVPPRVTIEEVPSVYIRWNRADIPAMNDHAIAERWRWANDGERQFWLSIEQPAGIIRFEGELTEQQAAKLRARWNATGDQP